MYGNLSAAKRLLRLGPFRVYVENFLQYKNGWMHYQSRLPPWEKKMYEE